MYNCAHLRLTNENLTVDLGKKRMCEKLFFHKVSDVLIVTIGGYWLIHDGHWVSMGQYGLIYDVTGSVRSGTG